MSVQLRKIEQQVMVITGATSGIGLVTARQAAEAGARLVLVARDADALDTLAHEMRQRGAEALTVAADVGNADEVERIGQAALARFGRVDTWVNNAGVGVYGSLEQTPLEDMRRVMQTNFWGVVHGSLTAVRLMKPRGGGAIITVGDDGAQGAASPAGAYAASKQAAKAFIESLRLELAGERAPISLTLVQPGHTATPFGVHARNHLQHAPRVAAPVYAPELAAKAILHAATTPVRALCVGGRGRLLAMLESALPRPANRLLRAALLRRQQQASLPAGPARRDALHAPDPAQALRQRDRLAPATTERSLYQAYQFRSTPVKAMIVGGALLAAWGLLRPARRPARRPGLPALGQA